jgi:prepilin-type N-terminal cleavage/methylation domain-containing protein/prepilin-type processing-associated H-X9-DG protein
VKFLTVSEIHGQQFKSPPRMEKSSHDSRLSSERGAAMARLLTKRQRSGLTLIELLVVMAIIGSLIGLLLPAVQQARQAANRLVCRNNLKQLGLASHNYHDAHNTFPPGAVGPLNPAFPQFAGLKHHGLGTYLLPHVDQQALYDQYRWDVSWFDTDNQDVVNTQLEVWQCPSAPASRIKYGSDKTITPPPSEDFVGTAACGDYAGINSVDAGLVKIIGPMVGPRDEKGNYEGVFPANHTRRLADIKDGPSQTILIAECAGRPQLWHAGKEFTEGPISLVSGGPWATRNLLWCRGAAPDGATFFGTCAVNCTNDREVYGFHTGGANVVFADGSVHFLGASIDIRVFAALVTRAGREVVSGSDY